MIWEICFAVKDYARSWSDQEIVTRYKGVTAQIVIKNLECKMRLAGEENVEEVFYLLWELLFLYDGYFYEPQNFLVDGIEKSTDDLIRVEFYNTASTWYSSELLGRGKRDLSETVIEQYNLFRNAGMSEQKMTKSMVNAFYYLHSEAYKGINSNHRLSLLLNIGDGFVINTFKDTNNVKASYDRLFKNTIDTEKMKHGISLLGISADQFKYNLAEERNMFDHYKYLNDSIAAYINNSNEKKSNYINWFFIYTMDLIIRINFLRQAGVTIENENVNYAFAAIVDWFVYENDLEEDCITPNYQMKQIMKRMQKNEKC
jgi:hypothetical protein